MRALTQWLALAPLFVIAGCSTLQQSPRLTSSESVISLSPTDSKLGEALAHYSQGLIKEAALGTEQSAFLHFKQAAALDPDYFPLSIRVAADYVRRKDYVGAVAVLKSLERTHPDSVELRLLLGSVYQTQGNEKEAVRCFQSVICMAPERADGYLRLAAMKILAMDSPQAMKVIREGLRHVKTPLSLIELCENGGRLFVAGNDIPGAIPLFEQVLILKPGDDAVREVLTRCYVAAGQERKALAELAFLLKKNPEDAQIAFWAGELYELLGDRDKALVVYNFASQHDARNLSVVLRKASLEMQADTRQALKTLLDAAQRFPEDVRCRVYLALLYMQLNQYSEAVKQFDDVARRIDQDESSRSQLQPLFYFWYGSACERVGRPEEAERYLARYLVANPDSAETLNYLAYMWAERGVRLDEAQNYITKALSQDPDNGAYLDTQGWILYKRGDYSKALKCLKTALRMAGGDPDIFDHLGDVCAALSKPREAIKWWASSLKMAPDNKAVREKLIKAGGDPLHPGH